MSEGENTVIKNMIEVKLKDSACFRKIRESLTRMGVSHNGENILWQSCHILHKASKYYICHFKEMYALDGKPTTLSEEDIARRNLVAKLLSDWNMLEIVNPAQLDPIGAPRLLKVIKFTDAENWNLVPKYRMNTRSRDDL